MRGRYGRRKLRRRRGVEMRSEFSDEFGIKVTRDELSTHFASKFCLDIS